jgi:hypothetical protein
LVIWSSELPHCNYANDSDRFRICHYVKMMPAYEGYPGTEFRSRQMKQMIPKEFQISELGKKMFGLESWNINKLDQKSNT